MSDLNLKANNISNFVTYLKFYLNHFFNIKCFLFIIKKIINLLIT